MAIKKQVHVHDMYIVFCILHLAGLHDQQTQVHVHDMYILLCILHLVVPLPRYSGPTSPSPPIL